jgi:tRNA pseudouridine38-40 synthase
MRADSKKVAIWCWYRGAGFRGVQHVQGNRTVHGVLMEAFAAAGLPRNPNVAARTDAGVSARMQVLSARVQRTLACEELVARLNGALPEDLQAHLAKEVPDSFHAAWSASGKVYDYALPADVLEGAPAARLQEAMRLVPGTRDFSVFHHKTSQAGPRTVRAVELKWEVLAGGVGSAAGEMAREACSPKAGGSASSPGASLRFSGEKFGRHMVRMLTGALLAVARGEVALEVFARGLFEQQKFHCPVAPPEPLTLWEVEYLAASDPFSRDEREAFRWPPR